MSKEKKLQKATEQDPLVSFMDALLSRGKAVLGSEASGAAELTATEMLPRDMRVDQQVYESMGIIFGEIVEGDSLFIHCTLPDGWKKVSEEIDPRHMGLFDEKGRKRAHVFYKNASYDRTAYMEPSARISKSLDYDREDVAVATVKDGEVELYRTPEYKPDSGETIYEARRKADGDACVWLGRNFPNWTNPSLYWDVDDLAALIKE